MFQVDPPEVFEVIRGSRLVSLDDTQENLLRNNKKVVVVSIFGTSHFNLSGHKRAFRLAIDCFGNLKLFKGEQKYKEGDKEGEGNLAEEGTLEGPSSSDDLCKAADTQFQESQWGKHLFGDEEGDKSNPFQNGQSASESSNGVGGRGDEWDEKTGSSGLSKSAVDEDLVMESDKYTSKETKRGRRPQSKSTLVLTVELGEWIYDIVERAGSLDGFYCDSEGVIFLHLNGAYDPQLCLEAGEELSKAIQETGFIPVWSTLKSKYCRFLLLMFSLSHILILSEVGSSLDTSYLHLFRVLDAVRLEIKPALVRILDNIGNMPKDWVSHGRICSPRLLFLFEDDSASSVKVSTPETLQQGPLTERQSQLEDEVYHILRKCRIVTNISANSLFAIPSEDEYIFLYDKSVQNAVSQDESLSSVYLDTIHQACSSVKQNRSKTAASLTHRPAVGSCVRHSFRSGPESITYNDTAQKFKEFLLNHIRVAQSKGFDDDSRRVADYKHFFVRPTFDQWQTAFRALSQSLLCSTSDRTIKEGLIQLQKFINVDSQYLENQCANVFPKIYQAYQRGLPEYYPEQLHQLRLTYAMNVYLNISRGPGVVPWLNRLAEKCDRYWKRGRQQCEVKSLLQHSCTNPMHRVTVENSLETLAVPELDSKLPEMPHSTGNRLISYCNCGRRQGTRDEPFTIKDANYSFYQALAKDCCERLDRYEFPIFKPAKDNTSGLSLQEMLQILKLKTKVGVDENICIQPTLDGQDDSSQVMETELRQENILADEDDGTELILSQGNQENEVDPELILEEIHQFKSKPELLAINDDAEEIPSTSETSCSRDFPEETYSSVEYLPGMLHSRTPPGLLPRFPSWSLVCVGFSSLYNHSSGVTPRQGFLNGTNFLLPWDVMVKAEAGVAKPVPRFIRGRRPTLGRAKPISDEFSVKVFFGLEYECQRGHRFFANDYEKIVNAQGSMGKLKEAGAKIANSDMPLYFKCPCKESRDGRTMIAQLMRVHVVTPKAPVHCIISPRVQPGPTPCPVFFPGNTEAVQLTPSSYWVLRFPYCYVGEEVYVQPCEADLTRSSGKLLKGTFSVKSMSPSETKIWEKQNLS